ncbi:MULTISPECIES: septum site-determining protein MinC [Paenibacillus]|jgi:septum site-determining protein MinC|uniref:Probable septum site-determining protein MinC n=1 Tax=Paenibacillus baimaensis TaxID=2982185 RepID=A0ABT2UHA4_9BACL|nr:MULTISPECIES: septum site-determining protein MinC [unclassified Paenibacillus]MCU6793421.1 septum site-determining protein MinC [Paenibacillus sp. WQ 127069]OMF15677.1 septum site-determining protein MinC [Paenibacillus sp. FSL H7-0331]
MAATKHHVMIKGVKEGLVFLLDDNCAFEEIIEELHHKLEKTHQKILTGPIIHVHVKLGTRTASAEQKDQIRSIIGQKGNLLIQSIESQAVDPVAILSNTGDVHLVKGIVRSGQTMVKEGNILFLGDVNPGGELISTGSIYVMGSLRGMAHAGVNGNDKSIIAASHLRPTQLRISAIISRPPDEWGMNEAFMEFAYVKDGKMEIDKIHHLHRLVMEP